LLQILKNSFYLEAVLLGSIAAATFYGSWGLILMIHNFIKTTVSIEPRFRKEAEQRIHELEDKFEKELAIDSEIELRVRALEDTKLRFEDLEKELNAALARRKYGNSNH